jgi:putative nucleotidyltransferase with HDIG domain
MSTATAPEISSPDINAQILLAVRRVTTLATLPEVTSKIVSTVENPKSSAAQLHLIVSHDPVLVTRILKVVNSAFYGLPGQIGSIERAIVLLGLNAVKNIAVAASLGQLFRGVKLCDGYTAKDLWTHCIAVGITARELAKQLKMPIGDEAFLAGMIHDIGLLINLQLEPEKLQVVCERIKSGSPDFCAVERDVIGMDHQQLGQALAELWKFPRSCQLVAGHHHDPAITGEDSRDLVALVHVADTLCSRAGYGFPLTAIHQDLNDHFMTDLKLDPAVIDRVKEKLPELLAGASSLLG